MTPSLATEYLNEIVSYGGIPTRRICVHRHLVHIGSGPTTIAYAGFMCHDAIDAAAPWQRFEDGDWVPTDATPESFRRELERLADCGP